MQTIIYEWTNNRVLLCRTENDVQYPVINYYRKEYEEEFVCMSESICCTAEINTAM